VVLPIGGQVAAAVLVLEVAMVQQVVVEVAEVAQF
jgi:hypothetical protein